MHVPFHMCVDQPRCEFLLLKLHVTCVWRFHVMFIWTSTKIRQESDQNVVLSFNSKVKVQSYWKNFHFCEKVQQCYYKLNLFNLI